MEAQSLLSNENIKKEPDGEEAARNITNNMCGLTVGVKQEPVDEIDNIKIESSYVQEKCVSPVKVEKVTSSTSLLFPAEDNFLYCDKCKMKYEGDCPEHGPLIYIDNAEADHCHGYTKDLNIHTQVVDNLDRRMPGRDKDEQSGACLENEGNEEQKRWKSLKDSFRREISAEQKNPSGSGRSTKKRKYVYFEQLKFLLPTLHQRPATSSLSPLNVDDEPSEEDSLVMKSEIASPSTVQKSSLAEKHRKKTERSSSFEKNLIHLLEKQAAKSGDKDDDDKQFLLSLLPALKSFDQQDKMWVRIKIMNVIQKAQEEVQKRASIPSQYPEPPKQVQPTVLLHQQLRPGPATSSSSVWSSGSYNISGSNESQNSD